MASREVWKLKAALTLFCLCLVSCNKSADQSGQLSEPSSDPAQANLAQPSTEPVSQGSASAPAPVYPQTAPRAAAQSQQSAPAASDSESSYGPDYPQNYSAPEAPDASEPVVEASDPPPPLPEYSQPETPGPNYLWNPGYWGYASAGYYWVPGIWVVAPYVGALWTPPYWGYVSNRYRWHHGYWGQHIGFYGGVNYGCGYVGRGYEGGYWNRGEFFYNRTVNRVNTTIIHNVYNYRVTNITNVRVSYDGGRGGLNVHPSAAEMAVVREQRIAPLQAQVAHMRQAEADRAQFASVNRGRPQRVVATAPLAVAYREPATHAVGVPGARMLPRAAAPRQDAGRVPEPRVAAPNARPMEPAAATRPLERPAAARPGVQNPPEARPIPSERPTPTVLPEVRTNGGREERNPAASRPAEQPRPTARPAEPSHMERPRQEQPRQEQPRQEQPRQEQPRQEQRPAARPAAPSHVEQPRHEQPRQEARPAAQPRQEQRPPEQAFSEPAAVQDIWNSRPVPKKSKFTPSARDVRSNPVPAISIMIGDPFSVQHVFPFGSVFWTG